MMKTVFCGCFMAVLALSPTLKAQVTPFDIDLNYTGPAAFQQAFDNAEARWEQIITGWTDGINITATTGGNPDYNVGDDLFSLFIDANVSGIDGQGGVLGSAGPTELVNDGSVILASRGVMNFDTADIQNLADSGSLEDVILHEMGHVLGIGTLWVTNGLYSNGSGTYLGANGLAQYQTKFNPNATSVPVELGGGGGTANGHWDEAFAVGGGDTVLDPAGSTVIDPNNVNFGRSRSEALLTGFLSPGGTFISNTTGGSLQDLGYDVSFAAIQGVPEPSSAVAIILVGIAGLSRRRRS